MSFIFNRGFCSITEHEVLWWYLFDFASPTSNAICFFFSPAPWNLCKILPFAPVSWSWALTVLILFLFRNFCTLLVFVSMASTLSFRLTLNSEANNSTLLENLLLSFFSYPWNSLSLGRGPLKSVSVVKLSLTPSRPTSDFFLCAVLVLSTKLHQCITIQGASFFLLPQIMRTMFFCHWGCHA